MVIECQHIHIMVLHVVCVVVVGGGGGGGASVLSAQLYQKGLVCINTSNLLITSGVLFLQSHSSNPDSISKSNERNSSN